MPILCGLSNFLSHFHRVEDLGSDGIQEVSGSLPLISTRKDIRSDVFFYTDL